MMNEENLRQFMTELIATRYPRVNPALIDMRGGVGRVRRGDKASGVGLRLEVKVPAPNNRRRLVTRA